MDPDSLTLPANWMEWVTVFGYLSFAAFIAWRVLTSK